MIVKSLPEDVYLKSVVENSTLRIFLDGIFFTEQIGFCTLFLERCSLTNEGFVGLLSATYGLTEDGVRYVEVIDVGVDSGCVYKLAFGIAGLPAIYIYPEDIKILENSDIVLKDDGVYVDNVCMRKWK